ncbi:MAG: DUF3137 domain-containing protein [Pseudomonadota bacterium]
MPITPPSDRAIFERIVADYSSTIEPMLGGFEARRVQALWGVTALVVAAIAIAITAMLVPGWREYTVIVSAMAGFVVVAGSAVLLSRVRKSLEVSLLGSVADSMGFAYRRNLARPEYFRLFRSCKLVPDFDEESWEDEIVGEYTGHEFDVVECKLEKIERDRDGDETKNTVFHGQLIRLAYSKRFAGTTVVQRDAGPLNRFTKPGKGYSHVGLASAKFERAFEVWSTDQVEARDLLDPVVLERFQALEGHFKGKRLRAAFVEGSLIIAVETGNAMSAASMFRSLNDPTHIEKILKEFDLIFDLIDLVGARVEGRISGPLSLSDLKSA